MATKGNKPAELRTIKAWKFKARCLKLMDEVAESGEGIIITENGRPVSRLVPYRAKPKAPFGRGQGRIRVSGGIVAPIDVEWEAETHSHRVLNP